MKNKPVKFTVAYKVVQVSPNGEMWSMNRALRVMATFLKNSQTLRYELSSQTKPMNGKPLFVCESLNEARKALKFYSATKRYILRGYAENLRPIEADRVEPQLPGIAMYVPSAFKSALCDSFIPIEIVGKAETVN